MASRSRGDEMQDEGWRQTAHNESISNSNDYASMQYHQQQSQQLGIQQQYGTRPAYSSREYEHAQRPQHNQQQHPRNRYDSTLPDNYSKEHIDMQEVSHYPPSQQYRGPHPAQDYSASGARSQPAPAFSNAPQRGIAARSGNGPAYAPAPVATASMADLRDSISNSTTNSDGIPAKKPKRVYNTAFGPFSWSDLGKRKYWKYYAGLAILSILVLLAVIFHDDIITWMKPIAEKIRDLPGGWAIFVGVMFIISFPPLFGHEVVCLLCGLIYGLWWGFAIVSLGTMLGEWGNFLVFKYWCSGRSAKMEEKDVTYACICRVIREGGFRIAFMARLSALPGHLTTPAFAACGMSLWIFSITAILTLPKQLMAVYLGTVFGQDNGGKITTSKIVEWVVLGISFLITIWAAWYIYAKMNKWRPIVLEERAANAIDATEVVERDPVVGTIGSFSQPTTAGLPRVTLSGEDGIVKSPSGRVSLNRWPFHGQGHNRGSDGGSGGSTAGKMEEGSLGDLDGAKRPLVADSASPAGYLSSQGRHYQNSLYPVSSGPSPYASTEDIGYGYADGGEGYSVPYRGADTVDPASSENVSMKWNPPQLEGDQPTYPQQNRLEQTRQRSPATVEQYSPASYREAYQTPPESAKSAPPARYEQASSRNTSPQVASSLPRSLEQSEQLQPGPGSVPFRHADESLQSSMAGSMPTSGPYSHQASSVGRHMEVSYPQEPSLPPGASVYPAQRNLMPQPSRGRAPEHSIPESRQGPLSSYPDMVNSRGGKPINTTQFHTGPAGQASSRYHTEPNASRPSVYHTGQAAPDAAYRAQGSSQSRRQQQEQYSQYPPAEEYHQPIDAPPRYQ